MIKVSCNFVLGGYYNDYTFPQSLQVLPRVNEFILCTSKDGKYKTKFRIEEIQHDIDIIHIVLHRETHQQDEY